MMAYCLVSMSIAYCNYIVYVAGFNKLVHHYGMKSRGAQAALPGLFELGQDRLDAQLHTF
jgi:hypothetical protein